MIDLLIIILYFAGLLVVGWKYRNHNAESYWVANRQYGTGRISLSLIATIFGASSTIGIIGLGYSRGLTASWWLLVGAFALAIFSFLLASRVRGLSVYTLPDILKRAYGNRVAVPAALMIAVAWCGIIAAQMIAAGRLVSALFPIDFLTALSITAIIFTVYTFLGGQISVIKTDFWQLLLFIGGLLIAFGFVLFSENCVCTILNGIPDNYRQFPISDQFGWYDILIYYPLIVGLPYLVGPDVYSRVFCARDNKTARKATLTAAVIIIPLAFLLAFLGSIIKSKFPDLPADQALPEVLSRLVPVGLKGIAVAGFLGAVMSSADSCLMSAGTIIARNVIAPVKNLDIGTQLKITRVTLLIGGRVGWLIATSQQGIIPALLMGYTIFVGGVVVPTLASFWPERMKVSTTGAVLAVIFGGGLAITGKVADGAVIKSLLGQSGVELLQTILGREYLSILPIIVSLAFILIVRRRSLQ